MSNEVASHKIGEDGYKVSTNQGVNPEAFNEVDWPTMRRRLCRRWMEATNTDVVSPDTLQDLLVSLYERCKNDPEALLPDKIRITLFRVIKDSIVDRVEDDASKEAELDAGQTYSLLHSMGWYIPTHRFFGKRKTRTDEEDRVLDTVRDQLRKEADGEIEIFRPDVKDISFA